MFKKLKENKIKIIITLTSLAVSFAFGRYSVPEKVKIETKIVEVEKKTEDTKKNNDLKLRRKKTVTEKTNPDGSKSVTTIIDDTVDNKNSSDTKTSEDKTKNSESSKEVVRGSNKVSISALGGIDFTKGTYVFGASVQRPLLGPITLGLWGLTGLKFGVSLGLQL